MDTDREWVLRLFRLVLLGSLVAACFVAGAVSVNHAQNDRLDAHQNAIELELKGIKTNQEAIMRNQRAIFRLTTNTAAALCLLALAPDHAHQVALIQEFNRAKGISVRGNPTCIRAVQVATQLIIH